MADGTLAEWRDALLREMADQYRESFVLDFATMTEGWPQLVRKKLLRFFTQETTPAYWLGLPPEEAQAQLRQWFLLEGMA